MLRTDDVQILQEIQKNTEMGKTAIETLLPKVDDAAFSLFLNHQELKYSSIHDRASQELLRENAEGYRPNAMSEMMLKGSIHASTMFDTSTSHIAGMMIQGSSRGMTELWKIMNHCDQNGERSKNLAEELMNFEQESVRELRKYL